MKKTKLLLCMLSLMSVAFLTACDDDDDNGQGGGGGGTNDVVAPASIAGRTMTVTINSGTPPFAESGTYNVVLGGADPDTTGTYSITDADGAEVSTGTYTYTPNADNTATLVLEDSLLGTINSSLTFDTETSGSMQSSDSTGGTEDSSFVLN